MKTILTIILFIQSTQIYAQNSIRFNYLSPIPYNNTLHTNYTQTRWYYQHILEEGYDPSELAISSHQALRAILNVEPIKNNGSKSILDIYKEHEDIIKKHQLNFK